MTRERSLTRLEGFRLHAVHTGAGLPLVLLHGLCGSHRWWRYALPALRERRRVHVPEMVGFGGSRGEGPQPTIGEMADIMRRWLDAMEIERTDFVGHSMGAQVAIHLATTAPDRIRRLVLVSAAGIPHSLSPFRLAGLAGELVWPRAWGRPTFLATIAADTARTGPRTTVRAIRHILADDVRPLLSGVSAPTLLVFGEHDPLTPVEDGRVMEEMIPDSRLLVIPDAAHNPMADHPEAFNRAVAAFLDEPDDRASTGVAG